MEKRPVSDFSSGPGTLSWFSEMPIGFLFLVSNGFLMDLVKLGYKVPVSMELQGVPKKGLPVFICFSNLFI